MYHIECKCAARRKRLDRGVTGVLGSTLQMKVDPGFRSRRFLILPPFETKPEKT